MVITEKSLQLNKTPN